MLNFFNKGSSFRDLHYKRLSMFFRNPLYLVDSSSPKCIGTFSVLTVGCEFSPISKHLSAFFLMNLLSLFTSC